MRWWVGSAPARAGALRAMGSVRPLARRSKPPRGAMNRILNGRYRIDGVVGDGGMAVVYRGWDLVLNRVVAIKVLREQYAVNESFLARFRREAQSAAGVAQPQIVNGHDVWGGGGTLHIGQ